MNIYFLIPTKRSHKYAGDKLYQLVSEEPTLSARYCASNKDDSGIAYNFVGMLGDVTNISTEFVGKKND